MIPSKFLTPILRMGHMTVEKVKDLIWIHIGIHYKRLYIAFNGRDFADGCVQYWLQWR